MTLPIKFAIANEGQPLSEELMVMMRPIIIGMIDRCLADRMIGGRFVLQVAADTLTGSYEPAPKEAEPL